MEAKLCQNKYIGFVWSCLFSEKGTELENPHSYSTCMYKKDIDIHVDRYFFMMAYRKLQ